METGKLFVNCYVVKARLSLVCFRTFVFDCYYFFFIIIINGGLECFTVKRTTTCASNIEGVKSIIGAKKRYKVLATAIDIFL